MDTLNHQLFTSTEKLPKKMLPQEHYGEKCMAHFTGRLTGLRQAVLTVGKERRTDINALRNGGVYTFRID